MKIKPNVSPQEADEILAIVKYTYGYDFTSYSQASIHRRIQRFMDDIGVYTSFDCKHYLVNAPGAIDLFLDRITVNVTEMFRDPDFYKSVQQKILPILSSYPIIKIWHAGCSTGEEVFSMAILFKEAGLLDRVRIYATDINPLNIEKAKNGIVSLDVMKEYTGNYIRSGGKADFASYYSARYNNAIISKELRKNIFFSHHNLVTDQVFNEFQFICCRNVLIYFNKDLQNLVLNLFYNSLSPLGYLALGTKESLLFTIAKSNFETIDYHQKIFRRNV